jgi:hypothetical protein
LEVRTRTEKFCRFVGEYTLPPRGRNNPESNPKRACKICLYAEGLEDRYLDAFKKAVAAVNNNLNVTIGTSPRTMMTAYLNRKTTEREKVYKQVTTDVRRNILINQKKTAEKTNKTRVSAENIKINDPVWLTTNNSQLMGHISFRHDTLVHSKY